MKLQDFFPFHETIVGMDGFFIETKDGFFINSSCVLSENGIIKPNQLFLLQTFDEGCSNDIELVRLLDVFYIDGSVYLYLLNMVTKDTKIISHFISDGHSKTGWKVTELNFFISLLESENEFTIQRTETEIN